MENSNNKIFFIMLMESMRTDFLGFLDTHMLKQRGATVHFKNIVPSEPHTAITHIMSGCNPGKAGFLDASCNKFHHFINSETDNTILSHLRKKGCNVEVKKDELPGSHADLMLICLTSYDLLDKIINTAQSDNAVICIVAPVFHDYVEKAVNINNFLREKEIIETDTQGNIIWNNSLAFQKGYGHLWINLIGRDNEGAVSPGEEYEEVREALIRGITEKLLDGDNHGPVVERVYKKEELFAGEYLHNMPDLIVSLKDGYGFSRTGDEPLFDDSAVIINKTKVYASGMGLIVGDEVKTDVKCENMLLLSIAPTLLYLMKQSIPSSMDGRVEERLFLENYFSQNAPQYDQDKSSSEFSEEDEDLIKDRLKGLGYL